MTRGTILFVSVAIAGFARELASGRPDRGNLVLLAFVTAFAFHRRRSAWVMPFFASAGLLTEFREGAGRDPVMLALFLLLAVFGLVEGWFGRGRESSPTGEAASGFRFRERRDSGRLLPDLIAGGGMILLAAGALAALLHAGGSVRAIGLGCASWGLGVGAIKAPLFRLLTGWARRRGVGAGGTAAANGLISAFGELGSAAVFLLFVTGPLSLVDLVGFGAGPAIAEAALLGIGALFDWSPLRGTELEAGADAIERVIDRQHPGVRAVLPVVERALCFPVHVFCRVLVHAGVHDGALAALVPAVAIFSTVDGLATFLLLKASPSARQVAVLYAALAALAASATLVGLGYLPAG